MDKKEKTHIRSLSLKALIDVCGLRPNDLYYDGCLIASGLNMASVLDTNMFRYPVRLDGYAISFCSKGSLTITSNLNHYTMRENMLYINLPGSILHVESVDNAEVYLVMCDEEFVRRIHVDLKLLANLFLQVERNPLVKLTEEDWQSVMRSFDEVDLEGKNLSDDIYSHEVMRTVLRLLIYKSCRIISRHVKLTEKKPTAGTRHEEYFHKFMHILAKNYMQERSVGFYAQAMNLTPKYLTTIIRQTSGRTAISWIDDYVILEAKNLLMYSTMSIQEISYMLNFPNQSFFGKYFKNHTGMTPSAYRARR